MNEVKLTRTDKRPLLFQGEELWSDSTKDHNATRWQKAAVYRTESGKYVIGIGAITCWQGERDHYSAHVCESAEAAVALLEEHAPRLAEDAAEKLGVAEKL